MKISNTKNPQTVIRFLREDDEKIIDFEAKNGETATRYDGDKVIVFAGLPKDDDNLTAFRNATANAVRAVNKIKRKSVEIILPKSDENFAKAATEATILANYAYDGYLSEKKSKIEELHMDFTDLFKLETTKILAECVNYARDLINENAAVVTPEYLAKEAKKIADTNENIKIEILDENDIRKKGLGLLWAVGKGSTTLPRLIVAEYNGDKDNREFTALVGKGLTFDSGGLNLKPNGSMESMRHDMSGAATVLGVLTAAAKLNPKINFIAVIPAAQSAIGKDAYFVGDVYRSYSGKSVEVLNTDAEGRLILADAFSYTIKNYKPKEIVDLATLTGAIVIALGSTIAGMFSNNDELAALLFESGERTGENLWRMPVRDEHREAVKSEIADILNTSTLKRGANSITAAAFLEFFAENTPWCHLDIAGTAWNETAAKGINPKYATGFGVRLIWDFLNNK